MKILKQEISARDQALCQLCVLSFRVEVKGEKDTKFMPCKWHSEVKYKVNCLRCKKYVKNIFEEIL